MMSKKTPRVMVIGCGNHAYTKLLPSLLLLEGPSVVMVCDDNAGRAEMASRLCRGTSSCTVWKDGIDSCKPDALIVAAPPQLHFEIAKYALSNEISIFVEKPPTVTFAQLEELADLAKKFDVVTMVGHNIRFAEMLDQVMSRAQAPCFGSMASAQIRYFGGEPRGSRWGLTPVRSFLLGHVIHAVDLLISILGDIKDVYAYRALTDDGNHVVHAMLRSGNNVVGSLFAVSGAPWFDFDVTLVGTTNQILKLDGLRSIIEIGGHGYPKYVSRETSAQVLTRGFRHSGYQRELEHFFLSLADNKQCVTSFCHELKVYRVLDEIETQIG